MLEKGYGEQKVTPNAPAPDEIVVRRFYLDLVGPIPRKDEASASLASTDPEKVSTLIEELIESEG